MSIHYRCYQVRPAARLHAGWEVCRLEPARRAGDPARVVVVGTGYANEAAARAQAQRIADRDGPLGWVLHEAGSPATD